MRIFTTLLVSLSLLAAAAGAQSLRFERLEGASYRLGLPPELGESWREVNVGRLVLRTAEGLGSLDRSPLPPSARLDLSLPATGCSLLQADLGPAATAGHSDSWQRVTRCTKIVVCAPGADLEARRRAAGLLTAKTGSRVEIRPLFNPLTLEAGSDLPVRLYFEGESVAGGVISAHGPGGVGLEATADGVGIATLTLPVTGAWTLRFGHSGTVAELIFDVP